MIFGLDFANIPQSRLGSHAGLVVYRREERGWRW